MSLQQIVNVSVVLGQPGLTQDGFGVPLIASQNAADVFGADITRSYSSLTALSEDFPSGTPEYAAAAALFAQQPSVIRVRVGKLPTNPVTQTWQVSTVSVGTVGVTYIVRVWNADGTYVDATYVTSNTSNQAFVVSTQNPIYIPLDLNQATTVIAITNSGTPVGDQTWTWAGTAAYVASTGTPAFSGTNGTLTIRIDEDTNTDQVVTLANTANDRDSIIASLNGQAIGWHATPQGTDGIHLQSNKVGSGAQIRLVTGSAGTLTDLGLAAGLGTAGTATLTKAAGSGSKSVSVDDFSAVTPAEVVAAIALADGLTGGTIEVNGDGVLQITSDDGGATSSVQVKSSSTAKLGFPTTAATGNTSGGATNDDIVTGLKAAIDDYRGQAWQANHAYVIGNFVTNDSGKFYRCIAAGTSAGSGGPTGTGSSITDGGVTWAYTGTTINDAPIPQITTALSGSVGSKILVCTAADTSVWFALEVADPTLLAQVQSQSAPSGGGLGTDLSAIAASTRDWYGLITLYNSSAYVLAAATWVESQTKLYIPAVSDSVCATVANDTATDVLHQLKALSRARTAGFFHPRAAQFADAAEMGRFFPISPGGENWLYKALSGVTAGWSNGTQYTDTQQDNLTAKNAAFYAELVAGTPLILGNGVVADGEYIDVVRGLDWFVSLLQTDWMNALIQNNKIPFTNEGIAILESIARADLQIGVTDGLIDPGAPPEIPVPTVTALSKGQVPAANRAARTYAGAGNAPGLQLSFVLAGAINKIVSTVTVSQ